MGHPYIFSIFFIFYLCKIYQKVLNIRSGNLLDWQHKLLSLRCRCACTRPWTLHKHSWGIVCSTSRRWDEWRLSTATKTCMPNKTSTDKSVSSSQWLDPTGLWQPVLQRHHDGQGLVVVDSSLSRDSRTATIVHKFASDKKYFFQAFSSAFVRLS